MAQLFSFRDHRIVRQSAQDIEEMRETAREGLNDVLSADLRGLSGRELRKLRDNIAYFDRVLLMCSPEVRKQIEQAIAENPEDPEAAARTVLEPLFARRRVGLTIIEDA